MAHITLSAPAFTGLVVLVVGALAWVVQNAWTLVSPQYAPILVFVASAIAGFLAHQYNLPSTTPTANAGAPSTAAGPPRG